MCGRLTTALLLMWDIAFTTDVIEFLMDMMMGSVAFCGGHLATEKDEPCMVILVPGIPVIVVEYIVTVMGCCMSSK